MVERAQETEIAVLAYQGRKLTRVRISTVVATEETSGDVEGLSLIDPSGSGERSADESGNRPLIDLGGALEALAGRASDAERFESESDREPLMLADPAENLGEVPLEELPAAEQEPNGAPTDDAGAPADAGQAGSETREEASSRRGVLGGLLRRGSEGNEREGRNRPMSTAARNATIEALERRIERQLEQLERQQRELAEMQAELARLKTER